jgi:hypothetical protein
MATEGESQPYSANSINVITFDEAVRRRPRMYFGLDQADPRLVVSVVQCAASTPFIWDLVSGDGPVAAKIIVEAGMRFTLSFNALPPGIDPANPCAQGGSLIWRPWTLAATAAVSSRATVEMCTGSRAWYQELAGAQPLSAPRDRGACHRVGTRATFDLDPGFFATGTEIPGDIAKVITGLGIRGEIDLSCCDLTFTDLRPGRPQPQ